MRAVRLTLVIGLALLGAPSVVAAPPCVAQCETLLESGELRKGVSQSGCELRVCQQEARKLYEKNQFEQALESLDYLQPRLQDSPSYQLDRGLVYYALGRFEEALASFEKVLGGFPRNVRAASQRAHTLLRLGRYADARAQFEKLFMDPATEGEFKGLRTRSYLKANIGVVKLLQGDLEGGKADLEQGIKIDGRNRSALLYRHKVVPYLESGALEPEGVMQLLVAYEELSFKRYPTAAQELQALVKRWPRFAPGYQRLAEILRSYQEYEACEVALALGEQYLPEDIDLRAERLRCALLRYGPTSEQARPALDEVRALAEVHPENVRLKQILVALDR